MSLKTEDSLNCPCNGIYKCGFHSVPKFFTNPYPKEEMDKFIELYDEIETTPPNPDSMFIKQFLLNDSPNRDNWLLSKEAKKRLFEGHYECKFTTKDQPPFD